MKVTQHPVFKYLVCPFVFILSLGWALVTGRTSGGLLLAALVCSYIHFLWRGGTVWMRVIWVAFIVSTLVPVDVSFRNYPGPPRFVPYFSGYPSEEGIEKMQRGELMWSGSCGRRPYEPKYVLVW